MTQEERLETSEIRAHNTRFILEGPLLGSDYPLDRAMVPKTLISGAFIRGNKPIDGHSMP